MMREDTRRKKKEIELVGVGEYSFLTCCNNDIKKERERKKRRWRKEDDRRVPVATPCLSVVAAAHRLLALFCLALASFFLFNYMIY